ncbi:MAG: hypothetical protein ACOYEV_19725, partial [Candidatus Nanopelagicales bacterium]
MTPIAPAVSLPALNVSKAAVALAAIDNPITALLDTGSLALNYLIDSNYTTGIGGGLANWGSSVLGLGTTVPNVGDTINGLIRNNLVGGQYLPQITSVGIVPNFLAAPFPIGIQVVNNWLGYAGVVVDTGVAVLGDLSSLVWAPVGITVAIANAVLTGNIAAIPTIIQTGIATAIAGVTDAIQTTVAGAQYILGSFVAKATALVNNLSTALPSVIQVLQGQATALTLSVTRNVTAIQTALATGNVETIWNTTVASLLGPTGIPGTVLNLTLGAGQQLNPADPTTYVPSVRATIQTLGQTVKGALGTAPASAAAVRGAAAKAAPAAAVAASAADTGSAAASAAPAPAKPAAAKVGRHVAAA